jgi:cysteine dioxygenase
MLTATVDELITGLCAIPEKDFRVGTVYDYLKQSPVNEDSLQPYLFFSKKQYTRNLIFKNNLFELMALCWDVGQASNIHNHADQNCWMAMPVGRLRVQNFRIIRQDERNGYCRLEPTDTLEIDQFHPVEVDPTEPVHQVINPAEHDHRAVSLHIYSKPYDRCLVYSLENDRYQEVALKYSSEYGEPCAGLTL